ncbi:MAG: 3-keto-5-aminohexanoate cleavage protein [Candidatus Aquilonibacter sp.]
MAYFTDDSLLPENMAPLMITAAPYGPVWMPQDGPPGYIPLTWDEQVQAAVDCYNAGATLLHIHVRDPKTGHISKDFKEYGEQIARLREAVPKMILQIGGSISFAPEPGEVGAFGSYEMRHKLTTIDPKPDQITVTCGTSLYDLTALHPMDEFGGTRLCNEDAMHGFVTWWQTRRPISMWKRRSCAFSTGSSPTSHFPKSLRWNLSSGWFGEANTWDR